MTQIQIMIVDDHPIVREGVARLVGQEPDLVVAVQVGDGPSAISALRQGGIDLAIVDLALPGTNGFKLIAKLRALAPGMPVVVLSMHEETYHAERALKVGAVAYVMKAEAADRIVEAIRAALAGEVFVSGRMAARMMARMVLGPKSSTLSPADVLTEREFEVFQLIGLGYKTRRIADQLKVSVKTIETHRRNIKHKLGLQDASGLAHYAIRWADRSERGLPGVVSASAL